jgi:adenylate cyclase
MTSEQKENIEKELTSLLKSKHSDLRAHVDEFDSNGTIIISFFWDRISKQNWNNAKKFKCHINDYPKIIETEILPFFK